MFALPTHLRRLGVSSKCNTLQHLRRTLSPSIGSVRYPVRTVHACHDGDHENFYRYTSGRWLWNEEAQLRERYKRFNVSELKKIAAKTIGAETCVSMSKLAESHFNKVFRLVMDDGNVVIAHIPNHNAGPPWKTTASEVATMDFARTVLDIPAPKVLSWSGEAENSVESEYILMEEITGDKLSDVWFQMELDDKLKVVNDVVDLQRKFTSVAFNRYGNLYFAEDAYPGCVKVEITGDLSQSSKDRTNNRFVIGPVVDSTFWLQQRASMNIDRGPWQRAPDYLKAIANREIAWISNYATPKPDSHYEYKDPPSVAQRTPAAHIALYKQFLAVSEYILPRGNQSRATLMHPNYHTDHIYVQKGRITGLVDWHGAWIAPLFLQAECPNLVRYTGELMLEFPEGYSALDDADRLRIRTQAERSILLRAYQTASEKTNPVLHAASQVPQARVRDQIVSFSKYSWDDGILFFRQALIWVARHWDEYNTNIPCPISFTPEEFAAHLRDGQGFNESQEFWDEIREEWMQPDGWIWNDLYEPTMEYFTVHRKDLLATSTGSELVMMEKILHWIDTKPE